MVDPSAGSFIRRNSAVRERGARFARGDFEYELVRSRVGKKKRPVERSEDLTDVLHHALKDFSHGLCRDDSFRYFSEEREMNEIVDIRCNCSHCHTINYIHISGFFIIFCMSLPSFCLILR